MLYQREGSPHFSHNDDVCIAFGARHYHQPFVLAKLRRHLRRKLAHAETRKQYTRRPWTGVSAQWGGLARQCQKQSEAPTRVEMAANPTP